MAIGNTLERALQDYYPDEMGLHVASPIRYVLMGERLSVMGMARSTVVNAGVKITERPISIFIDGKKALTMRATASGVLLSLAMRGLFLPQIQDVAIKNLLCSVDDGAIPTNECFATVTAYAADRLAVGGVQVEREKPGSLECVLRWGEGVVDELPVLAGV